MSTKQKTNLKLDVYRFNRDDVIAASIAQMVLEERTGIAGAPMGYDEGPWQAALTELEGYANGWVNRWDNGEEDTAYLTYWVPMCKLLGEIGHQLWD